MEFQRPTALTTDSNGMVILERNPLDLPVFFIHNEIENYDLGYIKWHCHPEMEFAVVIDEPAEFFIGDRRIILRKGEGIWINANEMHMIRCPDGITSSTVYTILLMPELIAPRTNAIYRSYVGPWIEDPELSYILFLEPIGWHREIVRTLLSLFSIQDKKELGYELAIQNAVSGIWLMMIQHQKEVPKQVISRTVLHSQKRIRTMMGYIQSNFQQKISLQDIADAAHVSKSECIRCFKKNLDTTPIRYLTEYRLETAARRLILSGDPVNSIAVSCGFDDLSYFDRLFRTSYGMPPSQYRRKNGKNPDIKNAGTEEKKKYRQKEIHKKGGKHESEY